MSYDVKSVIQVSQRLIDNSEQALLVFQDAGLNKGNYPHFSRALDNAREQSKELAAWEDTFTERELRLISGCKMYAKNDPAGLPGHNLMIIINKFCTLFGMNELP